MTQIAGYVDYQRREFCRDIRCTVQLLLDQAGEGTQQYELTRAICKENCLHSCHEFHAWLNQHDYEIVKPAQPALA